MISGVVELAVEAGDNAAGAPIGRPWSRHRELVVITAGLDRKTPFGVREYDAVLTVRNGPPWRMSATVADACGGSEDSGISTPDPVDAGPAPRPDVGALAWLAVDADVGDRGLP